jgi:acetylglutamate/LysW-gamma-L-alpha-aminoadipate kinase
MKKWGEFMLVVKVGGGRGTDLEPLLGDLKGYKDYILVHGGSQEANDLSEKLGKPPRMVTSPSGYTSRATDRETLSILSMAYAGKINVGIVERMQKLGINAVGLAGVDGRVLEGKRKDAITIFENGKRKVLRDDYTGKIEKVNVRLLKLLLDGGFVPVLTLPGISYESDAINFDADRAAAAVASAMGASAFVILSNVPGLLRDVTDPSSLIGSIDKNSIDQYMDFAEGRMKKKVLGAKEAVDGGVPLVVIAGANVEKPVTSALDGKGTVIK